MSRESGSEPTVLVVIPTLGERPEWLHAAIDSVTCQEGRFLLTVRIVAPSSADLDPVKESAELEVLRSDRRGLSAAINDGWSDSAEFDYLAWLGDDDLLAPGSLALCIEALQRNSDASAAYGSVRYIDQHGKTLWLQRPGPLAEPYFLIGKNLIPQQGSLFRSAAVREIGGVDESFRSAMDQDLFARLRSHGQLLRISDELGAFRLHESNITVTKGSAGVDEGDLIRRRHFGRLYPVVRPFTKITDRVFYWIIRHQPAGRPPVHYGRAYTLSS